MFRSENTRNGIFPFDYGIMALQVAIVFLACSVLVNLSLWVVSVASLPSLVESMTLMVVTIVIGYLLLMPRPTKD